MKKIKLGFLGVGNLVCKQHIPNAFSSDVFQIHTLCDLNPERLRAVAEKYAPERVTTRHREMLADPEVDAVVIATAQDLHAQLTTEALIAGKHVYVEKPLAEHLAPALAVEEMARQTGLHVAVGFNRRFAPAYQDAFDILKNETGPIMMTYRLVDDGRDRPGHYANWPRLLEECCHVFDIFNWFAKSRANRVYATGIGRGDDHQVIVEYENGVTGSLFTSSHGAFHWPKERLEIVGDHKVVAVDDFVELQTGGIPGFEDRRYRGREYEGFSKGYASLYEKMGLPFHRGLRSAMGDALLSSGLIEQCPNEDKWTAFAKANPAHLHIPINYACDKGWSQALIHFGECIRDGKKPRNTGASGAAAALAISLAAMDSVKRRQAVDPRQLFPEGVVQPEYALT